MGHLAPLINDMTVMLGLAAIVVLLFQRIRQPVVLGYIIAGIIVGPYTPPHAFISDIQNVQILSQLGVIFLMFALGLEFSFQKLTQVGFSASVIGVIEVVLMVFIGYLTGRLLGWSYYTSIFLGAALSISSTTIIVKAIEDLHLKTKRFSDLIFGILIVEDLLAILMLVALSTMVSTQNLLSIDMVYAFGKLILVITSWFLIGYFIVPTLFRNIAKVINQETLTLVSVALCLLLVTIAAQFNYSSALGAFIMGSILAETILIHRIEKLILPIRDIFAAIFFISVGMLIDPVIIVQNWQIVLLVALVTMMGKILTTSLGAILTGQNLETSIRVGFSMAQIGEFSFIIAALGMTLKVTNEQLYPVIVAVSIITTFTTPYCIILSKKVSDALQRHIPMSIQFWLNAYNAYIYRTRSLANSNTRTQKFVLRFFINGVIVAIIFSLVHYLALRKYQIFAVNSVVGNTLFLFVSLVLASPFIWGMLSSYPVRRISEVDHTEITPGSFFIALLTLIEVAGLSLAYFHTWITIVLFFSVAILLFVFAYKHLEKSYKWFEEQLISNLQQMTEKKHYAELAPWDTHLVEVETIHNPEFIGKTLADCQIRQRYGVNIVAVNRGKQIIIAPRGDEKIHARDTLIVLGTDEQLEAFRQAIEMPMMQNEMVSILAKFTLRPIYIDEKHPWLGKSIRETGVREDVNGLVAGLQRGHARILNPDPDTILKVNDIILVFGESKKLRKMRRQD